MNDTFDGISRKLLLRCPKLGPFIARDLVKTAFHDLVEKWQWSWLLKRAILTVPAAYRTGLATTTYGSSTVTLTNGGIVSVDHVGRQFRTGLASPILTITDIDVGANTYTLSDIWTGIAGAGQGFQVYLAYLFMPSDFRAFFSVTDPANSWAIQTGNVNLGMIDARDLNRSDIGSPPRALAPYDYYNGLPRYELWPHQTSQAFYLMAYEARPIDPYDAGASVPPSIPSDVILECALMYAAKWPGPNRNDPNPYYSDVTAKFHSDLYDKRLGILVKSDVETMQSSIWYQSEQSGGSSGNASYMQSHDMSEW